MKAPLWFASKCLSVLTVAFLLQSAFATGEWIGSRLVP